ncbi:alpha/beta hydrolase [Streptomyces sp. NPDC001508]|uniref:alpha/beta hydrolase n=1 Tax=Streptomyces sp. NPDC001508 TaxID=3154656 RepID=UPI0033325E7B
MSENFAVPPLDPELAPALEALLSQTPRIDAEPLAQIRDMVSAGFLGEVDLTVGGAVEVVERRVPGPPGAPELTLLVLTPSEGDGLWPLIYNTHGGGMVLGDAYLEAPRYVDYVAEGLCVFVAVDYRLAPENPDPAPIEDCYAGLVWTVQHADELRIDPAHVVVAGSSAGGGLAAGTTLLARDRGFPAISHQILLCPMLDDRFITASSRMLDGEGGWDRNENEFGWTALLGERRGGEDVSIYAAPGRATVDQLRGLPRTFMEVGGRETFRDETIGYALRTSEAGVSVDLHVYAGGFHSYDLSAPDAAVSKITKTVRDEYVRRALRAE